MAITTSPALAARVRVILLAGQSNMEGQGQVADLPMTPMNLQLAQTDVLLFGNNIGAESGSLTSLQPAGTDAAWFGPEVTFGRAIADARPTASYAIINIYHAR